MKKNVIIFGLVLGTILSVPMLYMVTLCYTHPEWKGNDVVGYAAMVVVFSLIFFGVRNYRNKQLNGFITFGKAFRTGALIALTGASLYVAVWLVAYYNFFPDFMDVYVPKALNESAGNASAADFAAKKEQLETMREMYKNPLFVILFTYVEVLPIGLVVALISALVLKKKNKTAI
jgi:hypothetical protein